MKKRGIIKNAIIITITSFVLRIMGMVIRSFLSSKIGAEGMGLYQLIISIYVLASTFVTAGISTAVIRLVTEAMANNESEDSIQKIVQRSILISMLIAGSVIVLIEVFARTVSVNFLKDRRVFNAIRIFVIALPFIAVSSCLKSFFIAKRKVMVNSFSQLLEQGIRMILLFLFLEFFTADEMEKTCVLIILCDIISEIISCFHLFFCYHKEIPFSKSQMQKRKFPYRSFFQIAFPVAINRYLTSSLRTFENILIPNQLMRYTLSKETALSQFGMLKGMALPLLFFPASFLTAISTLMVPEAAEARTLKQNNIIIKLVEKTISFTLLSAIPIAGIFFLFSKEIATVFYPREDVSFYLKGLSFLIPFMYLESAITGVIQGLNEQKKSLQYNLIDSVIRISLIMIILPKHGIKGFMAIMYLSNIITSSFNTFRVLKSSKTCFHCVDWIVKPLLSFIASCSLFYFFIEKIPVQNCFADLLLKVGGIAGGYVFLLILFGVINKKDTILLFGKNV